MNARTIGLAITAIMLPCASTRGLAASTAISPGFAVEQGRVASFVGTGLPYQPRPTVVQPVFGSAMYSDSRLKTDVRGLSDSLSTVLSLRGVSFRWDATQFTDRSVPTGRQIGFIAQDVQRVLPEVVTTDNRGYLSVQYSNVVPVLVEAIKEQQKQIDAKDAAIEKLRSEADEAVKDLQTRLDAVESALTRMTTPNNGYRTDAGTMVYGGYSNQGQRREIAPGVFVQW